MEIDTIERRYRRIFPLLIYARYYKQVLFVVAILAVPVNIVVLAGVYSGHLLGWEIAQKTPLVMAILVVIVAIGGLAVLLVVLDYFTSDFGKIAGLIWIVLGLGILALFGLSLGDVQYVGDVVQSTFRDLPVLAVASGVLGAAAYLFVLHILWVVMRGAWALLAVRAGERRVLRESRRGLSFLSRVLFRLWGLPPSFEFARRPKSRYAAILVLSLLSASCLSIGSVVAPNFTRSELQAFEEVDKNCRFRSSDDQHKAACIGERATELFEPAAILLAVVFFLLALGWGLQRLVQRLVRFSLEELQRVDPRAPVLFLRAFGDDQIPLRPPKLPLFAWLVDFGNRHANLDRMLLEEATPYGPVVGLGNPRDKRPPYGAARGYFDDKTWQEAVIDLLNNSAAIVICLDDTDGVWWEVEELLQRPQELTKTLFLMHPRHMDPTANKMLLRKVASRAPNEGPVAALSSLGTSLHRQAGSRAVIGFFFTGEGGFHLLQSQTFSRFAYFVTLRVFLRELLGTMPRPLPAS